MVQAAEVHVAVVVVSYNTRDLLRGCLASVIASQHELAPSYQVSAIVVDNASHDGSAAMVRAEFPTVRLVASEQNLGFTGGNNLALSLLGFPVEGEPEAHPCPPTPEYVLLLNADAVLQPGALRAMLACHAATPGAGICGAHLTYGDGRFQHGAFRFPNLFQIALDFFPLTGLPDSRFFPLTGLPGSRRIHDSGLNGRYPRALWEGSRPFAVDFVLGAAMLASGPAICQVGGLDARFFMYCEEIDWCLRMCEAGWRTYAVPDAHVTHYEGQSSRQVRWAAYERLWRSRFLFFAKHQGRYPATFQFVARLLVRAGLNRRRAAALDHFRRGRINGVELGDELAAYTAIARL